VPDRGALSGAHHRPLDGREAQHAGHEGAPELADHPAPALQALQRGGGAPVLLAGRCGSLKLCIPIKVLPVYTIKELLPVVYYIYIINNALFSSIKIITTIQFVSVLFGFVLFLTAYNVLLIYQFYSAYF